MMQPAADDLVQAVVHSKTKGLRSIGTATNLRSRFVLIPHGTYSVPALADGDSEYRFNPIPHDAPGRVSLVFMAFHDNHWQAVREGNGPKSVSLLFGLRQLMHPARPARL
jgi:hypothetical protein